MKRKITGWFLIMLMTVFTVTANANLHYCLCNDAVVLGDCICEQPDTSSQNVPSTSPVNTNQCCESCHTNTDDTTTPTPSASKPECLSGKANCLINLSLSMGDFVLTVADQLNTEANSNLLDDQRSKIETPVPHVLTTGIGNQRGSPPASLRSSVPIYIRDSVYRL